MVSKCSWTHVCLSRIKKGIVTPWDRQICPCSLMVELWAYTSAYAARLADGAGSNPAGGTKTFRLINGYSDPEDKKWCDSHGWYTSNRKCAGNARTDPVGKRVEVVCDGSVVWVSVLCTASSESIVTWCDIITAGGRRAFIFVVVLILRFYLESHF